MAEGEGVIAVISTLVAITAWIRWYVVVLRRGAVIGRPRPFQLAPILAPLIAAAVLLLILKLFSAHDVRNDPAYLYFYTALGMAWVGLGVLMLPLVGISLRHDVKTNRAAALVAAGWIVALTLAFAGGNIGDGPGWWVVVFSSGLASGALALVFAIGQKLGHAHDAIVIDRDAATAMRTVGLLVSCGIIFGVAAAGDWESAGATLFDFLMRGWPSMLIVGLAAFFQRWFGPSPRQPRPSLVASGVLPVLMMLVIAAGWAAFVASQIAAEDLP